MSRNRELGLLLRARREQLSPDAVGIVRGDRRRVAGLRREEVAELAGISVDWYTRLERGRAGLPSAHTLEALAHVLHLPAAEYAHLQALILPRALACVPSDDVPAAVARLIEQWKHPAYLVNERWDLLAWNDAAGVLFGEFGVKANGPSNLLRYMLLDENARFVFAEAWAVEAQRMVGKFRRMHDQHAGRHVFDVLIEELKGASPDFAAWWPRHDIVAEGSGQKALRDRTGTVHAFSYVSLHPSDAPQLRLALYMPAA
ncbi:helix-turn-helix transcriptional regulator [Pseudomonas sp. KNUC1026]|uniref:helix-turn-helix transcriptional regulator n=1 Tax=Pseudomonas sp. KNUC1026 TaxID=2893890 RepID=UPI001F43ABBD|nr:helix-turn-helix transcriptional regulator [Pseudomonas sp. KNUC1026]UFH51198.1 helix-turn-helix transcriptional regulator [Pseudomonas sp. KNUC1026]